MRSDVFLEKMAVRVTFSIILYQSGRSSGEAWIKRHHNSTNSLEVASKESIKGTRHELSVGKSRAISF